MAMPVSLKDHPIAPTAAALENMKAPVFAESETFRDLGFKAEAHNNQKRIELNEHNDELGGLQTAMAAYERELVRLGVPIRYVPDPKNPGKTIKQRVDWQREQFPRYFEVKARIAKLHAMPNMRNPWPRMESWLRKNPAKNWKRITKTYHEGDARSPFVIRDECVGKRTATQSKLHKVMTSRATADDAKRRADADIDRLAKLGKPEISGIFSGYSILATGEIHHNESPEIAWSSETIHTMEGDQVPATRVAAFLAWLDPDALKRRVHADIDAQADDENAVPAKDRPALVKKLEAAILDLQRAEESAYRMIEAQGHVVERPPEWPIPVMLQIEPNTAPVEKPAPVEFEKNFEDGEDE